VEFRLRGRNGTKSATKPATQMLESPVSVPKILADSIPEILRTPWVNIKPETFLRWHQKGFQLFWRWKNRGREAGLACPGSPGNFEELREADKCPSNSERNIVWLPPLRAQTGSDVAQIFAPPELRKCPSRRRPAPFSHLGSTPLTGESPAAKDNPSRGKNHSRNVHAPWFVFSGTANLLLEVRLFYP